MNYAKLLDFYTHHAIVWHALSLTNIIPNTYSIALFVFIFGTILQLFHVNKKTDGTIKQKVGLFILHLLPLIIVPYSNEDNILIVSLFLYFLYMKCNFEYIRYVYHNMYTHLWVDSVGTKMSDKDDRLADKTL